MNRAIVLFIGVAYGLSIALGLIFAWTGGYEHPIPGLAFVSMFIPAIAVLVVRSVTHEDVRSNGWDRFPLRYLPFALFLMPVVMHAVMLPMTAAVAGRLPWEDWLTPQADGLYHTPASRGWGVLTGYGLAARIATNAVVGLIVVSFLAFFEEVGWRVWLLPRVVDRLGPRLGVVVVSIAWAGWHVPFALSGLQHIDGVAPAQLAITLPLGIAATGVVLGWLWLRTGSIWMVALAHGAMNNWGQYAFKYMGDAPGLDWTRVLRTSGPALVALAALLLAFGLPPASKRADVGTTRQR